MPHYHTLQAQDDPFDIDVGDEDDDDEQDEEDEEDDDQEEGEWQVGPAVSPGSVLGLTLHG
jgi:hypothetical protein